MSLGAPQKLGKRRGAYSPSTCLDLLKSGTHLGIFQALDPKTGEDCTQGEPIFLDPGDYTLKATIAGVPARGESGISIVAGEAVQFTWY